MTVQKETQNPVTKVTEFSDDVLFEDTPCKLVFKTLTGSGNGVASSVTQSVKLILGAEKRIPSGSKITVTQNGITADYEKTGEPGMYTNHQEIMLELFSGWA